MRINPRTIGILAAVVLLTCGGVFAYKTVRWKRFAVVVPGRIYRSGQLAEHQFSAALAQLQLKRVICLTPEKRDAEQNLCKKHGVDFHFFEMPSDGLGEPEKFSEVLRLMTEEEFQPVLIHCSAGVARTGASTALFRVLEQGWSVERALEELASFERRGRIDPRLRNHVIKMAADFDETQRR